MNSVISFPVTALKVNEHFLARDVYNFSGILIAKKDSMVTKKIMVKLNLHGVDTVTIKNFAAVDVPVVDHVDIEVDISPEKMIEDMKAFEKDYRVVAERVQDSFKDIEEGVEINPQDIMKLGQDVIEQLKDKKTNLFSYLTFIKSTDTITFDHCLNVSIICQILGKYIKMDDEEIELLATAALLHDIGKSKIDPNLIHKSGSLTPDEVATLQNHVLHSYKMIENHDIPQSVKLGVLMHHERTDGSGYILHHRSEKIHKFAKIIAIVDIYEAMTHPRPYREKFLPLDALAYIKSIAISKLDYSYATSFIAMISNGYKGNKVRLSNGQVGEIIFIDQKQVNKPLIQAGDKIIDLKVTTNLRIIEMF